MADDVVNIEVDGVPVKATQGRDDHPRHRPQRRLRAALLLPREARDRRQLPHVPGGGREGAQAAAGLRHAGDRGHEDVHQVGARHRRAARDDGVPAHQPPARLPDLRPGRGVRAAGSGGRLRPRPVALPRAQARGEGREPRSADRHRHDALHPVHALRAFHRGDRRHPGARHDRPRRAHGGAHLYREHRESRALRQCHRPVPGRRAGLQALPLHRARLGDELGAAGLPARCSRQQPVRPRAARAADARGAARERSHQRDLDRRPRPLQLRGYLQRRPAAARRCCAKAARGWRATGSRRCCARHRGCGATQLRWGCWRAARATVEELYLAARLARGLGSHNIDHRLRQRISATRTPIRPFPRSGCVDCRGRRPAGAADRRLESAPRGADPGAPGAQGRAARRARWRS